MEAGTGPASAESANATEVGCELESRSKITWSAHASAAIGCRWAGMGERAPVKFVVDKTKSVPLLGGSMRQ